jgi:mono/diheme cytochrome c family protein
MARGLKILSYLRRALLSLVLFAAMVSTFAAIAVIVVELRWTRTFAAPYPDLQASPDPAVIARGKSLVYGAAACAYCHLPRSDWDRLDAGETPPLTGGHRFRLPFGDIYSRNLTPDVETGIGGRSDAELARLIRHGVLADGRAAMPLMKYHGMSDEDLVAVISFLRTQPAVRNAVPENDLTFVGKALMAFKIAPPPAGGPRPVASPASAPTPERGRYLVENVLLCGSCHSSRKHPGGGQLAGGEPIPADLDPDHLYVPPNLTPDPKTGHIYHWPEETFLARFRGGKAYPNGVMPWGAYRHLSDDDLRAVYRYLRTLPPIEHASGAAVIDRKPG